MIFIQDLLGRLNLQVVLGGHRPGKFNQPVKVRSGDGVFRGRRRHLGQAVQLPFGFFQCLRRKLGLGDPFAQFFDFRSPLVLFPQLLLNGFELLPQEIFPLGLVDPFPDLGLDLGPQFKNLKLFVEQKIDLLQPRLDLHALQNGLLVFQGKVQSGSDQVSQNPGLFHVHGHDGQVRRKVGSQLHKLLEDPFHPRHQGLRFGGLFPLLGQSRHLGPKEGLLLGKCTDADAGDALNQQPEAVVGHFQHLEDVSRSPDFVQVFRLDFGHPFFLDGRDSDHLIGKQGCVDELDMAFLADHERKEHFGKQNRLANGKDGKVFGNLHPLPFFALLRYLLSRQIPDDRLDLIFHRTFTSTLRETGLFAFGTVTTRKPSR